MEFLKVFKKETKAGAEDQLQGGDWLKSKETFVLYLVINRK